MIDVFVNKEIALQVSKHTKLEVAEIRQRLEKEGVQVTSLARSKKFVL